MLRIIKPGVLDLIQDSGRYGFSAFGINPGGPMDSFASKLANILVGNNDQKPVIEMHFPGPQILFTDDALISITGADFNPTINDQSVPLWHPVLVRKNTLLQFSNYKWGNHGYLAVHGGFVIDKWLNSYSTNLKAGVGGWKGRKLERGDEISVGYHELQCDALFKTANDFQPLRWSPDVKDIYADPTELYYIEGREAAYLSASEKEDLHQSSFSIQPESDRMGYRLKGISLTISSIPELLTSAVSFGTMQLMPDGQLVILMADHHTTGGYPRIGHIISAHLPKLAQLKATDRVTFTPIELTKAESLHLSQLQEIENLKSLCFDHLNQFTCIK